MTSLPPDDPPPWRTPDPSTQPRILLREGKNRDLQVIVRPGADAKLLAALLSDFPPGTSFVECFGDVDIMLLFRPPDPEGVNAVPTRTPS
ncbi:hypothetical protein [Parafrankia sp. EUN1f]|uniref:hypothetical protein n=1 Tax=Parafrankia sp. EUN1f TaxID=102897 RepID=UPI0001C4520B|nr:hypothetical protein [Parafrankia sp. EUN1f]EFC82854.1 hypothetical protein FrEUN1fDRAFT_4051 [Parafrankia sp. EUN1f]